MSIPDLKGLLETAQRIQSEVARVREELARKTVVGETGGGLCRCTANGKGEILSIVIDEAIVGDKKMIEDLATGAVNIALQRARELAEADLAQVTGGLPVPPGMFGS
jgi:nucleoid-associated protein EbfC